MWVNLWTLIPEARDTTRYFVPASFTDQLINSFNTLMKWMNIQASREPFMCMNLWMLIPETRDTTRYFVPACFAAQLINSFNTLVKWLDLWMLIKDLPKYCTGYELEHSCLCVFVHMYRDSVFDWPVKYINTTGAYEYGDGR